MSNESRKPWFWRFRIGGIPVLFLPSHWAGVLLALGLVIAVMGCLYAYPVLGILPAHPDFFLFSAAIFCAALVIVAIKRSEDY
ncbi:MAG TPA: hypothetical protein VMS78_15080 [Rhizomicrobium sp.]|nr:hypothetical protein [Rhizomicrobium sp.]